MIFSAIGIFAHHYARFLASEEFKRVSKRKGGKHYLDFYGPTGLTKVSDPILVSIFPTPYFVKREYAFGKAGRLFRIDYLIGQNANKHGGGGFEFRVDYWTWENTGPGGEYFLHYYLNYDGVYRNHEPLL